MAELDDLLVRHSEIIPLEVKSGAPAMLKSSSLFLDEHHNCKKGLVFYSGNIKSDTTYRLKYMPLYTKFVS